jgi:hypothetical protein
MSSRSVDASGRDPDRRLIQDSACGARGFVPARPLSRSYGRRLGGARRFPNLERALMRRHCPSKTRVSRRPGLAARSSSRPPGGGRPLPHRYEIIFRFCDISRVCRQEKFPSVSHWLKSHARGLSATRLCSSWKWLVREAAVEFTARARSNAPSPSRSGNARPFRHRQPPGGRSEWVGAARGQTGNLFGARL